MRRCPSVLSLVLLSLLNVIPSSALPPSPLLKALGDAVSEAEHLQSRLELASARVGARLRFEESLEDAERVSRARARLSPLPTAVPRVYAPGDAAVRVFESPLLAPNASVGAARVLTRAGQRSPSRNATDAELVAASVGVILARARALPALLLSGVGVADDFERAVVSWNDDVPLARLLATPLGARFGESPTRRLPATRVAYTPPPPPAAVDGPFFLGAPWTAFCENATAATRTRPPDGISLFAGGAARTRNVLAGVPLFSEPNATHSKRTIAAGVAELPRALASARGGGALGQPSRQTRKAAQWWILAPVLNEPNGALAREAAAVRLLQAVGLVVAPVRGVWEIGRVLASVAWGAVQTPTTAAPSGSADEDEDAPLESAESETLPASIFQRAADTAYWLFLHARRRLRPTTLTWAAHVVWNTAPEAIAVIFPPRDSEYHRAEVAALERVLAIIRELADAAAHVAADARARRDALVREQAASSDDSDL